ncbi:MAG TPA: hypothetical protein VF712_18870 [Thermoleophilaceae bacterium]|jgi:hypothetical protein
MARNVRARRLCVSAFLALAVLGAGVGDASARRITDYKCTTPKGPYLCGKGAWMERNGPVARGGPLSLSVPDSCRLEDARAIVWAVAGTPVRRITLRLDGAVIGSTRLARPHTVAIDCEGLAAGEHVVSATLVRRDGSRVKVTRVFARG